MPSAYDHLKLEFELSFLILFFWFMTFANISSRCPRDLVLRDLKKGLRSNTFDTKQLIDLSMFDEAGFDDLKTVAYVSIVGVRATDKKTP